jgi:hypothetical protein
MSLKSVLRSFENKSLAPRTLESLTPFSKLSGVNADRPQKLNLYHRQG